MITLTFCRLLEGNLPSFKNPQTTKTATDNEEGSANERKYRSRSPLQRLADTNVIIEREDLDLEKKVNAFRHKMNKSFVLINTLG